MQRFNPCHSYRAVATQTATPGQLVLMLYEGAIRFLEQARLGFSLDDPLEFNRTINNNIQRAQAIIQELNETLDLKAGGQLAATMRALYNYMDMRLHDSNQHKTEPGIVDAIKRLTTLRDAWAEMLQKQNVPSESQTTFDSIRRRLSAAHELERSIAETVQDQWRILTEREREAIQGAQWSRLAEIQAEKQRLQDAIMLAGKDAANPAGPDSSEFHRALGEQLLRLEQANAEALAEQRRVLQHEQRLLDQTCRNLHQVHRAYAQGREPAWQSYS